MARWLAEASTDYGRLPCYKVVIFGSDNWSFWQHIFLFLLGSKLICTEVHHVQFWKSDT